ncbi:DUF2087 domain-containing protein [Gracilibacillus sp. S3-1-1]|uniref:DUF2087 domain-containing protein n=1 Tax=Gracilibacillus pellucidus TaxID=3095368 RepID=A0ACC6M6R6_9BACI|nr:DUF2087 domain-containing protein [Gracilibacillus sp. S3-1-1]MDX8046675.1 DUF2087 domain-containing protein [Gracilibacillus sp. S3-1-1]
MSDIKQRFFKDNQLMKIPKKEKDKRLLFDYLLTCFDEKKLYTEKQVNDILKKVYLDYAILRRYLVDYRYLSRADDGSSYRVIVAEKKVDNDH